MLMRLLHRWSEHARAQTGIEPFAQRPGCTTRGRPLIGTGLGYAAVCIAVCLSSRVRAEPADFNGAVALSSQLVDRGQAITGDTPVLQAAASWNFATGESASGPPSGWSLGLVGSTEVRSPGRIVVTLLEASRYWPLTRDWQMQVGLLYYGYTGRIGSRAMDRAETGVSWTYRDVLTLGLSAIYVIGAPGHQPRGAADLDLHWPLAGRFSLSIGAGISQSLATYDTCRCGYASREGEGYERPYRHARTAAGHYGYGHVGLLWSRGPWRLGLERIVTDAPAQQQWGDLGATPWVATVSRSF
jgi:hypothetical protein